MQGRLVASTQVKFGMGHVGPLGRTKFHVNGYTGKSGKFPLFGKVAPQGRTFWPISTIVRAFYAPNYPA